MLESNTTGPNGSSLLTDQVFPSLSPASAAVGSSIATSRRSFASTSPSAFSSASRSRHNCSSNGRSWRLVARAAPPSTTSLILAFVLPLSLLVGTIFTAVRVADRLDEKYLEELAMHEAIMEERVVDDDDSEDGNTFLEDEDGVLAAPRVRNRPKREA